MMANTMYLVFAIMAGVIGGAMSILMRMELQDPGLQIFHNTQTYNVFVTSHGLIMIFFMVMPAMIGGVRNLVVGPVIRAPHMAFPPLNHHSSFPPPGPLPPLLPLPLTPSP